MVLSPAVITSPKQTVHHFATKSTQKPKAEVVDLTVSSSDSPGPEVHRQGIQAGKQALTNPSIPAASGASPNSSVRPKDRSTIARLSSSASSSTHNNARISSSAISSAKKAAEIQNLSTNGTKDVTIVYASPQFRNLKSGETKLLSSNRHRHTDPVPRSRTVDVSIKGSLGRSTAASSPARGHIQITLATSPASPRKRESSAGSDASEFSFSEEEEAAITKTIRDSVDSFPASRNQDTVKSISRQPLRELNDTMQTKTSEEDLKSRSSGSTIQAARSFYRQPFITKIYPTPKTKVIEEIIVSAPRSPESVTCARIHHTLRKPDRDINARTSNTVQSHSNTPAGRRKSPSRDGVQKSGLTHTIKSADSTKHKSKLSISKDLKSAITQPGVMTISAGAYETNLRGHLAQMRQDQAYFVENKLRQARTSEKSLNPVFMQSNSPFEGLQSVRCDGTVKNNVGKFGHFVRGSSERNNSLIPHSITTYKQDQQPIPPYTAYISAKRNVLTEDDRQRTFLPYHGDDFEVDDADKEYAALETKIEENQIRYHRLNRLHDQARMYRRYAETFLAEIGCTTEAVLRYLLNENPIKAPNTLPKEYKPFWELRTNYLKDGYYEEEDDQAALEREDTPYHAKPRRQWQQLYAELGEVSDNELAVACLACQVFQNSAGFSLFHIVQGFNNDSPVTQSRYSLGTYAELACFICKVHECPGHGEYHDSEENKNLRERVNFKPGSPDPENKPIYKLSDDDVTEHLGLQDDGEVIGSPWTAFRSSKSLGFEDADLCSDDCFWAKQARVNELSDWSKGDIEAFNMLRPAFEYERRGACLMSQCGLIKRTCKEIFLKLLQEPSQHTGHSLKIRNEQEVSDSVIPPRRTIDQWFDDPTSDKAWRQDAREPFLPCDHLGPCSKETNCSCFVEGVQCEKSCACSNACARRYQGCRCHAKGKPCKTDKCECKRLNRECDPDICANCGSDEVLDPVNRHDEEAITGKCGNVAIQRGVPKRTLLGPSKLMADGGRSGWGLYMGEECKKGDFIGEYRGEIISEAEADQRGTIYDKRNMSYLFTLNGEVQTLDSTLIGNKLRFINHQADPMANCYARLLLCHGVVRIGMFALKDIAISEEMFFNYGEDFATKFDLIKMNPDGSVTVERPQKQSRPKETFKRRVNETRPSQYQLKNKVSKNGLRVGRPPKGKEQNRNPSSASESSRKRRRSDVSDMMIQIPVGSKAEPQLSKIEELRHKRPRYTSFEPESDESDNASGRRRTRSSRLETMRRSAVSNSPVSTPSRRSIREASHQTESMPSTQSKTRSLDSQQEATPHGTPTRAKPKNNKREPGREPVPSEEEDEEEEDTTPRRSNRRRLEKQHFDETTMTAMTTTSPPSPIRARRTARKEVR